MQAINKCEEEENNEQVDRMIAHRTTRLNNKDRDCQRNDNIINKNRVVKEAN